LHFLTNDTHLFELVRQITGCAHRVLHRPRLPLHSRSWPCS
jgi:hypothetical protein